MKLYLLTPKNEILNRQGNDKSEVDSECYNPWRPWYDKVFGMIVAADDEERARLIASKNKGQEENFEYDDDFNEKVIFNPWLDSDFTNCQELDPNHFEEGLILRDFRSA